MLNIYDVARSLGEDVNTVLKWSKEGFLEMDRYDNNIYFYMEDVLRLEKEKDKLLAEGKLVRAEPAKTNIDIWDEDKAIAIEPELLAQLVESAYGWSEKESELPVEYFVMNMVRNILLAQEGKKVFTLSNEEAAQVLDSTPQDIENGLIEGLLSVKGSIEVMAEIFNK